MNNIWEYLDKHTGIAIAIVVILLIIVAAVIFTLVFVLIRLYLRLIFLLFLSFNLDFVCNIQVRNLHYITLECAFYFFMAHLNCRASLNRSAVTNITARHKLFAIFGFLLVCIV